MDSLNVLNAYVILNEAVLVSWRNAEKSSSEMVLEFQVSEWNFTKKFSTDFSVPGGQADAHNRVMELFPDGRLTVICSNIAHFIQDRLAPHHRPELLMVRSSVPEGAEAYMGPLTVYRSTFQSESDLLKTLGEFQPKFFHWIIDVTDARFHVVAEGLRIPNFPIDGAIQLPTTAGPTY